MIIIKPAFFLIFIFLMGNAGFVLAQYNTPPQIINPDTIPVQYCSDSVPVAPNIFIRNITINDASEGMKVSIANYRRGEDILVWKQVHNFKYEWNNYYGHVEIKGVGTDKQYQNAIANIYYKNLEEQPGLGIRSFSISLLDADYLPATQHFYRYVKSYAISWSKARDAAANMEYYGLQGYLATIRSKAENDFIQGKTEGTGWIGASDARVEQRWEWVTGPDSAVHFWQGDGNGRAVNGEYSNWGSGEPNNLGNEHYGHILHHTEKGRWNDLADAGGGGDYTPQGFLVEFGGMPGDPEVKLSASASVQVSKIAFSDQREFEICSGEQQQLNLDADNVYKYYWVPNENINDPTLSNPIVSPHNTTTYKAIGKLQFCTDTADFLVRVNPLPISKLPVDTVYCKGASVVLDPGKHSGYLWSNGETTRTITVRDEGRYWVRLTSDIPCTTTDTVDIRWSVRPELDYSLVDTLICGKKSQTLTLSFLGVEAETNLISLDSRATVIDASTLTPTINVTQFDRYEFEVQIVDEYGCQFLDTLNIEFHNQPEAVILMDEEECKGYSLEVSYGGTQEEEALFSWYYNDSLYKEGTNLDHLIIPLGYGQLNRKVGLKVNEQGCFDSTAQIVTVTPIVDIDVANSEGCTPLLVEFEAVSTESVYKYYWDFGDGNTAGIKSPSNEFSNTNVIDTTFDISLTILSTEGCENTGVIEKLVRVHPKPTVDLSFDEEDCNPGKMEIWYAGSGNENDDYYWNLSSFLSDEVLQNPGNKMGPLEINRHSEPTAQIGIHVLSEFGCSSDTLVKNWKRKPVFEVLVDTTEGCPPLDVAIRANILDDVDEVTYQYDLGDGTSGTDEYIEHVFGNENSKNSIQFTVTSAITNCEQTILYNDSIFVYPTPEAQFTPVPEVVTISEPEIKFENTCLGANYYEWDFGDMSPISTEDNPVNRYSQMGFFNVLLTAYNQYNCSDTISKQVIVAFDKVFPPNAFSPNASTEEDREFRIYSEGIANEGYSLLIFNRWGEIVFESNSQEYGWDGKMKNDKFAPTGVYTWILQYLDFQGKIHKQQGTVSLLY